MAKYGLALHTSSPALGLAIGDILDGSDNYRSQSWPLGRETSNVLQSYLATFMVPQSWSDLAWVAVAIGPGGFTGTRLAVVTARTIGEQLQIPVFGISSLAAIAWSQGIDGIIAVEIPAQREQLHTGIYSVNRGQRQFQVVQDTQVMAAADWELQAAGEQRVAIEAGADVSNTVTAVWELAKQQWEKGDRPIWSSVLPIYGQSPV